jgi:hypothetical protein
MADLNPPGALPLDDPHGYRASGPAKSWALLETEALEAERKRLEAQPAPATWDRASWLKGAQYAIAWIINRRGAAIPPLAAASPPLWPTPDVKEPREDG